MTTTADLDANIDTGILVEAEKEDGLVELGPEDLSSEELERRTVDLDEALALNAPRDGFKSALSVYQSRHSASKKDEKIHTGSVLLLAENLDCLWCRHCELWQDSFLFGRSDLNFLPC